MKRIICIATCLLLILGCVGCNFDNNTPILNHGNYYADGDFEEGLTPYVSLTLDEISFRMGAGDLVSFQAYGSFEINGNELIATTQLAIFVFEIKDPKTIVLIDSGDNEYFQFPENTQFVFFEDKP